MKKSEIKVGAHYTARISGRLVTVQVDSIRERDGFTGGSGAKIKAVTLYEITNLRTGRRLTFRSAQKFRMVAVPQPGS